MLWLWQWLGFGSGRRACRDIGHIPFDHLHGDDRRSAISQLDQAGRRTMLDRGGGICSLVASIEMNIDPFGRHVGIN